MRTWMWLLLAATSATIGCGGGADGDPTGVNEGTLEVIASTTGADPDPDGYRLSVDDGTPRPLFANGADTIPLLSAGTHTVTLAGLAGNCLLTGENPRSVDITAAATTSLRFDIACNPSSAIFVSAATTGEDLDADGYRVAVDGGNPQSLAVNGSVRMGGLASGEHDVVLSDVADNCGVVGADSVRVTVLGGLTVTADFAVSCSPLPLAPPGHDIAFGRDGEVYLLSADGTTLTNLTDNPDFDSDPAWSPDGQAIAFSSDRSGSDQLYLMNADGGGQSQLTSSGGGHPAWSPDGGRIAFSSNEQIFVMNSDGSAIEQLTADGGNTPTWSPDGTRIAFMGVGSFETDIFVMNADGSDVVRLATASGIDANPDWSPDGTKIAFNSDRSGERHIHVMNADGTAVTQLTFGAYQDIAPEWSPEGSKIAFYSSRTGISRLYMMNADGTEQVPLTPKSFSASDPVWRP